MNKLPWLSIPVLIALCLVGAVFCITSPALGARTGAEQPPLALRLPHDISVYSDKAMSTLDLWPWTRYHLPDKSRLTYTVTQLSGATVLSAQLTAGHYLSMSLLDTAIGQSATIQVEVGDATLYDTLAFTATVRQRVLLPFVLRTYPPVPTLLPIENTDGDGMYLVDWEFDSEAVYRHYDIQYATTPDFANAITQIVSDVSYYEGWTITPATYYWRARVHDHNVVSLWSNTRAVTVDQALAYLHVVPLCAFDLRIEIDGPISATQTYSAGACLNAEYWQSVPLGEYSTRLTWLDSSILEDVPATRLDNALYVIDPADWPTSRWLLYTRQSHHIWR